MAEPKIVVAGWSLTRKCNLRCIHCYSSSGQRDKDELTLEEAIKVADKLKEANVAAVNFGGGECCLRDDFIDLCKYLNKLDIKISYTTNGLTFGRIEPYLNLFHDIGVSIDFGNPEKHDKFRGIKGTFDKAVSTLEKLVANSVDTEIVTCITKMNCSTEEMSKMYNLAKSIGVDYWRLNRFRSNGRGKENENKLALTKEDLKNAYDFLASKINNNITVSDPLFRAAYGGIYSVEGDPSGFTAFRIQANGEVTPSVFLTESGGNVKEDSIDKIFSSPIFMSIRNRVAKEKCVECESYTHCRGGDAGASYLKYGHFNGSDPLCWLEPNEKRPLVFKQTPYRWNVHEMYLCTLYIPINPHEHH